MVFVRFRGDATHPTFVEIKAAAKVDANMADAKWRFLGQLGAGADLLRQVHASMHAAYTTGTAVPLTVDPAGTILSSP